MTEEQKKAKLDELRERLKAKRSVQSEQDKEDARRNEVGCLPFEWLVLEPQFLHAGPYLSMFFSKFDKSPPKKVMISRKNSLAKNRSKRPHESARRSKTIWTRRNVSKRKSKLTRLSVDAKLRKPRPPEKEGHQILKLEPQPHPHPHLHLHPQDPKLITAKQS